MERPTTAVLTLVAGLLLAVIASGCDSSDPVQPVEDRALSSSQGAVTMQTVQSDNVTFNACTGESVHVQGPMHFVIRQRSDGTGGFILGITRNVSDVKGTGLSSGVEYKVEGTHTFQARVRPPFPITLNEQFRLRLVPPGDLPVALVNGWDRFTVDANGQVRVDVLVGGHYTCPGQ